jgi:catechol-2,3-dioxygenase
MQQRLTLVHEVARWKWNAGQPVTDAERERELLHGVVERGRGVPVKAALNHGVSLSFYFEDPEEHLIEVYRPTGVLCRPRHGDPIDLTHSEEALRREVAEQAAG